MLELCDLLLKGSDVGLQLLPRMLILLRLLGFLTIEFFLRLLEIFDLEGELSDLVRRRFFLSLHFFVLGRSIGTLT